MGSEGFEPPTSRASVECSPSLSYEPLIEIELKGVFKGFDYFYNTENFIKIYSVEMVMKMSKKGAIELSMTTIIVIVIGVTLLILGLTWVRGLFEKVSGLTEESFRAAEKLIQDQMASDEKFYISGLTFDLEGGKSETVYTGIQNFGTQGASNKFRMEILPGEQGGDTKWFTLPPTLDVEVGKKKAFPFVIQVPRGTEPGSTFTFTVNVYKDAALYDNQPIIVKVK